MKYVAENAMYNAKTHRRIVNGQLLSKEEYDSLDEYQKEFVTERKEMKDVMEEKTSKKETKKEVKKEVKKEEVKKEVKKEEDKKASDDLESLLDESEK